MARNRLISQQKDGGGKLMDDFVEVIIYEIDGLTLELVPSVGLTTLRIDFYQQSCILLKYKYNFLFHSFFFFLLLRPNWDSACF